MDLSPALDFSRGLLDVYAYLDSATPDELIEEDCVKKVHEKLTEYMSVPDSQKGSISLRMTWITRALQPCRL